MLGDFPTVVQVSLIVTTVTPSGLGGAHHFVPALA